MWQKCCRRHRICPGWECSSEYRNILPHTAPFERRPVLCRWFPVRWHKPEVNSICRRRRAEYQLARSIGACAAAATAKKVYNTGRSDDKVATPPDKYTYIQDHRDLACCQHLTTYSRRFTLEVSGNAVSTAVFPLPSGNSRPRSQLFQIRNLFADFRPWSQLPFFAFQFQQKGQYNEELLTAHEVNWNSVLCFSSVFQSDCTLADLGFFRGGDFGDPRERSERALRGCELTGEWIGLEDGHKTTSK